MSDFDWNTSEEVVARDQPSVAVYLNGYGQVVLRRERHWDEEEDSFIHLNPESVPAVVSAMLKLAGLDLAAANGAFDEFERREAERCGRPKDKTAAERQRRHRGKNRDTVTVTHAERDQPPLLIEGKAG